MALTPNIRVSQGTTRATVDGVSPAVTVSQAVARTVFGYPSDGVVVSQTITRATAQANDQNIRVSMVVARSVVRGRIDDPKVRAWTFTLDGHDYYVLRLGQEETLVFDTLSKEWYVWGSGDSDLWRAYYGVNWIGGRGITAQYGSDVVVGDDGNGSLYVLDHETDVDDDFAFGSEVPRPFTRQITAQHVLIGGYDYIPCFGVQVWGSTGQTVQDAVQLEFSDDRGVSYQDAGSLTTPVDDYHFRLQWSSLGSMQTPGRLFRITDDGALKRIDGVQMEIEDSAE